MASKFPTPGELFEDTYRIEAILGSGGFARVYRAVEVGLQRPVALKILRPPTNNAESDSQRDNYLETLMERFQREAMMLSRLRSSYTVNLYKYGKTEDGLLYMALEYIDGLSLAEILRAGKPLEPERVVKILKQVLMSLQEAHTLGMLHRDLKPANIMVYEHLGQKDHVKLLDFGIAKLVTEPSNEHVKDLTSDGTLIGTPRYMAPEQIQGIATGPPSDIYALGLVAYELITGERAIKGDSSIQIIGMQLGPESFLLPEGDNVPPGLRYVINKMMEKDLSFRYESCDQVVLDLNRPSVLMAAEEMPDIEIEDMLDLEELSPAEVESEPGEVLPAVLSTRENLLISEGARSRRNVIVAVVILMICAVVGFALAGSDEPVPPPPKIAEPTKPVIEVEPPPKEEPEIQIIAKLDGVEIEGVTVLVDGVDKGVTPLTLKAGEIRNARVVARYQIPDRDTVEDAQEVTDPRDVLFEFDKVVSELIRPEPGVDTPEPEVEKPAPTPRPRPVYKPKPKPKPVNVYAPPE